MSIATQAKAEPAQDLAETPILKFHLEKEPLKVGEPQTVYMQAAVGFTKNEIVLETFLDGILVGTNQTAPALWILSMNSFTEIKGHLIEAKIYIRDAQQSTRIREALAKVDQEISLLNTKIAEETDQAKKDALILIRDDRQAVRDRLDEELSNLKVFFKSESLAFQVLEDPENAEFPKILDVLPALGAQAGGTVVQITGSNFPTGGSLPVVKIGGINASVASANSTTISFVTPSFASPGTKNVEVFWLSENLPKNAFKQNAFYAAPGSSMMSNVRPVAVTNGYQVKNWPNPGPTTLNGSLSYDENGNDFSYSWVIKAVAKNSSFVPGAVLSTLANPVFTPDKKGTFSFELKVRETSTSQTLESFPATATVEVN